MVNRKTCLLIWIPKYNGVENRNPVYECNLEKNIAGNIDGVSTLLEQLIDQIFKQKVCNVRDSNPTTAPSLAIGRTPAATAG